MSAIALSNSIDLRNRDVREAEYLDIVKKYKKEEVHILADMFPNIVTTMEKFAQDRQPHDVLGDLFNELELSNHWKGQYFTPHHICEFMGEITMGDGDNCRIIKENGYIKFCEPSSGSGAMVLGLARAMYNNKFNYCKDMFVEATDIDIICVYMTYIQLSLYGIPARVIHGNSLSMERWSAWITPTYIFDGWNFKLYKELNKMNERDTVDSKKEEIEIQDFVVTDITLQCEQISLF